MAEEVIALTVAWKGGSGLVISVMSMKYLSTELICR